MSNMNISNIKKNESYDIYIGRNPGHKPSILSNLYRIGVDGDRIEVIGKYAYDFRLKWRTEPEFRQAILDCRGKTLGCFCSPDYCHGEVIKAFIEALDKNGERSALAKVAWIAEHGIDKFRLETVGDYEPGI